MKIKYSDFFALHDAEVSETNLLTNKQMYEFVNKFCKNKKVLDIGCSVGRGLGLFSENAIKVVGLDIDQKAIKLAKEKYKFTNKIKVICADFDYIDESIGNFDLILILQTIYLLDVTKTLNKLKRILNPNGKIIIKSINPDRKDFNPWKYSKKYHKISELNQILKNYGFNTSIYGSIKDGQFNEKKKINLIMHYLKVFASKFKLIPSKYKHKKILKRIFLGHLKKLPDDIRDIKDVAYIEPILLTNKKMYKDFKTFYIIADLN